MRILPESQELFVRGSGWQKAAAGFSFSDLLMTLGVLSLLLLLQISAFAHNKGNSHRAVCSDNLHRLALGWLMYADDNRDQFPDCTGAVWPWDLPAKAANAFVKNGGTRNILYCPAFWKQNDNELWRSTTGQTNEVAADNAQRYRVIGYAVAFKGSGRLRSTNITESFNPAPWRMADGTYFDPGASERVVAADGTLSYNNNEVNRAGNRYTGIMGGWSKPHDTAHLEGKLPSGGNLVFLDGHAEWRKFQAMHVRTDGSPPHFWW